MGKLFNIEAPFWQFMTKVADLILLNILFFVSCLPIVTIGAAVTAMYDVTWKMIHNEGTIWSTYWAAFKLNFKQATVLWIIVLVTGLLIGASFFLYLVKSLQGKGLILVLGLLPLILWACMEAWIFPLQSRFYNSVGRTLKNALFCSIAFLPRTLVMAALNLLPIVLYLVRLDLFLFGSVLLFLCYFSVVAYLSCRLLRKPMEKLIEQTEAASEKKAEEQEAIEE